LYRELTRVPFYVPFGHTGKSIEVHPLLFFPLYFGTPPQGTRDVAHKMVTTAKYLHVTPAEVFFPYIRGMLDDVHSHLAENVSIGGAMGVKVPRVLDWRPLDGGHFGEGILDLAEPHGVGPDILREVWGMSHGNVFLEFSLGAYLVWPSSDSCNLLRGLWVIIELEHVYVSAVWESIGKREGSISVAPGMHCKFRDGLYVPDPQLGDEDSPNMAIHLWWMAVFLRATRWLREGGCTLRWYSEVEIFHLERPNEEELTSPPSA